MKYGEFVDFGFQECKELEGEKIDEYRQEIGTCTTTERTAVKGYARQLLYFERSGRPY